MSVAHGWSPNDSHYIGVILKLGESKEFVFVLGFVENAMNEKWESKNVKNIFYIIKKISLWIKSLDKPIIDLIKSFDEKDKTEFLELLEEDNNILITLLEIKGVKIIYLMKILSKDGGMMFLSK